MLKITRTFSLLLLLATLSCSREMEKKETLKEEMLVSYVKKCIALADQNISKLTPEILAMEGMSSSKVRHLLNNLGELPNLNYLEIGVWKGSTWVSTLFNNCQNLNSAVAIDNWFLIDQSYFFENNGKFLTEQKGKCKIISEDSFKLDKKPIFNNPVNVYFYDGEHTQADQKAAFVYYNDILDDVFVALVDDWNFPGVPEGTREAFRDLNYNIIFETILPAHYNGDRANWWNGLYVAVIKKPTK